MAAHRRAWRRGPATGGTDGRLLVTGAVIAHVEAGDFSVGRETSSKLDMSGVAVNIEVLLAEVTDANLLNPDPLSLVPTVASTIAAMSIGNITASAHNSFVRDGSFVFAGADKWTLNRAALYVLGVYVSVDGVVVASFYDTFGLRPIRADPTAPRP